MEEWKIGEIFEYNGEWYQTVEHKGCQGCAFLSNYHCGFNGDPHCVYRSGGKPVIFKKLEKVGEPYEHYEKFYQCYKLPMETEIRLLPNNCNPIGKDNLVEIEIKQKEDMEEKKIQLKQENIDYLTRKIRYLVYKNNDYDRATEEIMNLFIPSDTEHSSSEKIGKNLKPFDLEAAKAGKPVCTRDGRKVRIICFDRKDNTPEILQCVHNDGKCFHYDTSNNDLMMLPEKKEGWINIYNADTTFYYVDGRVFETKDEAVKEAKEEVEKEQREKNEYIDTIRVEWEE